MMSSLATRIARPFSVRRSLQKLATVPTNVLVISPTTAGALAFARTFGLMRPCIVTRGPITASVSWPFEDCLRSAAEISHAFSGQPELPTSVISFPDQLPCITSTCVMVPCLDQPHAFSTLEALLVLRHRPRVFALCCTSRRWGFRLVEIQYAEAFDVQGQLVSLGGLVNRLLVHLISDLANPPTDWLARKQLALKSERMLWLQAREEMKDIECLLRMQLQSRFCDRERTTAALAAVIERQKILIGTSLP